MNIDPIAAPQSQSPELRYASLHRSVENGLATERTWAELLDVCLVLGRNEEALRAFDYLRDPSLKRRKAHRLQAAGIRCEALREPPKPRPRASQVHRPQPRAQGGAAPLRAEAAEIFGDSLRYLFLDHLPVTLIVATVTFPLLIGLGGFLSSTAGPSAYFALSFLALVPALSALGMVGALVRRVLLESARGLDDPPAIPTFPELCREALRFGGHVAVLGVALLGPGILGFFIQPLGLVLPLAATALGLTALPMALLLRELSGNWQSLHPQHVARAIRRGGLRYFKLCGFSALLLAPAAGALALTIGSEPYMAISVVGPLLVTPLFVIARMFGHLWADLRRTARVPAASNEASGNPTARASNGKAAPRKQSLGRLHRDAAHPEAQPASTRRVGAANPLVGHRPEVPGTDRARMPVGAAQQESSGRRTGLRTRAEVAAATRAPSAGTIASGRGSNPPRAGRPSPAPHDPASIPGARVVRGNDRQRIGASARRR